MAGKIGRPRRIEEPSKPWNIVFPITLIDTVRERAERDGLTPASLVRKAIHAYVSQDSAKGYKAGVRDALYFLREEAIQPRFPSGQTLGDRLADRVLKRLDMEKGEDD